MTSHKTNKPHRGKKSKEFAYRQWKGQIIGSFGTFRAAARAAGCHYNSVRLAGLGLCPKVRIKLENMI